MKTSGIVLREKKDLFERNNRRQKTLAMQSDAAASTYSKEISCEKKSHSPDLNIAINSLSAPTESVSLHQYRSILKQVHSPPSVLYSPTTMTQGSSQVTPLAASILLSSKQKSSFIAWLMAYRRRFSETSLDFGLDLIKKIVNSVPLSVDALITASGMSEYDGRTHGEHVVATIYSFLDSKDLLHLFPHAQPPLILDSMDWKDPIEYWKLNDSREQPSEQASQHKNAVSAEKNSARSSGIRLDESAHEVSTVLYGNSQISAVESPRGIARSDSSSKHSSSNKRKYAKLLKAPNSSEEELDSGSENEDKTSEMIVDNCSGGAVAAPSIEGTLLLPLRFDYHTLIVIFLNYRMVAIKYRTQREMAIARYLLLTKIHLPVGVATSPAPLDYSTNKVSTPYSARLSNCSCFKRKIPST